MDRHIYTRSEAVLLPLYPRLILTTLLELGYDHAQIFNGLDLSAEALQDEHFRLTIAQHEAFILRALALTDDPHFAIQLNQRQRPENVNVALLAVANSGQISKALDLVTRYFKVITRVFSIRTFETENHAVMELDVHLEHPLVTYFAVSSFALFLDRFFQPVLGNQHLVKQLELPIPAPPGFEVAKTHFPFTLAFDQAGTRVIFNKAMLDQPMKQADPQTVRMLVEMSERQLAEADAEMGLVGAVKGLLIENIAAPPTLSEAARLLGLSARSLRRKLAESETTYQTTLDTVRATMAQRLLRESTLPVASIAYELGYNSASDFSRAFKKWTGQPPSTLRKG